jgi:myo-inositol-1-phosphate synthase
MESAKITNMYEHSIPMWDEAEKTQTIKKVAHKIETVSKVPKVGVMLVGLGGNNGSTFVAGILANKKKQSWETKNGIQHPNFHGSFTQSATCHVGFKFDEDSKKLADVYKPVKDLMPMVNPCDFEISGWDINNANLFDACKRSHVLEPTLVNALKPELEAIVPLPSILNQDYIAANQSERVNNVFNGTNQECIDKLRKDIQDMKAKVDKVIVLWTANTEMYMLPEVQDVESLKSKVDRNAPMPASVLFAVAAIEEQVLYLNGSP